MQPYRKLTFDAGRYQQDFSWAGILRGFRVAIVVPTGRARQLQQLLTAEQHDFALVTTTAQVKQGFHQPIWLNHENTTVDILGTPRDGVHDVAHDVAQITSPIPRRNS